MIEPDGAQVIDREAEAELFQELLRLEDQRQLFLVSDYKQRGKTTLLRKLKYHCDWHQPRIPCALVRLDDLPDSHPFALVEALYDELQAAGVAFPEFQRHRDAIRLRDPAAFMAQGVASFQHATISGGQAAGFITNVHVAQGSGPVVVNATPPAWDASLETYAREAAIRSFFRELRTVCDEQLLVCLVDSVDEQANRTLISWVLDKFVRAQLLDAAECPRQFVMALAGRSEQSPFTPFRQNYPLRVQSVEGLGAWSNEHVRAFLDLNRPPGKAWPLTDADIDFLRDRINRGDTLEKALSIVMVLYGSDQ